MSDMTPNTRKEHWLARIAGEDDLVLEPQTREEHYYQKIIDSGGGGGSITIDDTMDPSSENPVQNKVIKAALDGKGTYSKPSGGIPKSDLSSAVQTSLGKADTALQSVPSTYRTAAAQDLIDATLIPEPANPVTGAFLVYNGSAWVAQTLSTWQGGSY